MCDTVCGDGVWVPGKEGCDDGNFDAGDGCTPDCFVEKGAECRAEDSGPSVCQTCGDGRQEGTEACDDGGASGACVGGCAVVVPGWRCTTAGCMLGPAEVAAPAPVAIEAATITWQWEAPDGFGAPVLYYLCALASVLTSGSEANWTAAVMLNATPAATSGEKQQLLAWGNLSAGTAYQLRVRACSAVGCGRFGQPSIAVRTPDTPPIELLRLMGGALEIGLLNQVTSFTYPITL